MAKKTPRKSADNQPRRREPTPVNAPPVMLKDTGFTDPRTQAIPKPDPIVAADAGQFFRVVLINHIKQCAECSQDTRAVVTWKEQEIAQATPMPLCTAHIYTRFADWMVGV